MCYIYIYICVCMCVWVSVCVRGWVAKEGIFNIFDQGHNVLRDLFVYFGTKSTQKRCAYKNLRDQKKKGQKMFVSQEWGSKAESQTFKSKTQGWSVGSKTWVQSSQRAVWSQERRYGAVKTIDQMSQYFW